MAISERTRACRLRGKPPELARLLMHRIVHILHDFAHEKSRGLATRFAINPLE